MPAETWQHRRAVLKFFAPPGPAGGILICAPTSGVINSPTRCLCSCSLSGSAAEEGIGPVRLHQLDQEDGTLHNASLQQFHNGILIGPRRLSGGAPRQSSLCLLLFLVLFPAIAWLSVFPACLQRPVGLFLSLILTFLDSQKPPALHQPLHSA